MQSRRTLTIGTLVVLCLVGATAATAVKEEIPTDPLEVHSVWQGTCNQARGRLSYPMLLFIRSRKGNTFRGTTWYPTLGNGLIKVSGQIKPKGVVTFTEDEVIYGKSSVISGCIHTPTLDGNTLKGPYTLQGRKAGDIFLMTMASRAQEVEDPEPERFAKSIAAFAEQDSKSPFGKGGIVFVGSSSVRMLDIPKFFPGLKALNRGFGGAHISDLNYYIEETVLKYEPSKVIFFCGGNDLWADKSVLQVKEDFDNFRKRLFERVPDAELIVLGIRLSPRRIAIIDKKLKMNAVLNNIASDDKRITYLNGSVDRFLDEDGQPIEGLYADDRLHMNDAGYRIWAEILAPFLP